ncbi:uracil phosphoribosyltransferase [Lutibacter sp.]|jgi:uncharacterized membrane protein|uniref:DUF6341 family protein n=1 Tax=Lutibacter sp. TaxID=1925666 RepID=UPI001A218462|nr:uracil phosphoribosyltransferase [Lutibacter sp.]MBI9039789.1 uracil phosphoribosyltransferase [Lutibacter sp.]
MIANNIFKAIGDFFTNVLFSPYNSLRSMDNWWLQSTISWIFIVIAFVAFLYWMGEIRKYKKAGNE